MKIGVQNQQPIERLDYDIDYNDWIDITGDSISTVQVDVMPTGLDVSATIISGSLIKLWVEGGEDGTTYTAEVTILTAGGRKKQDEIDFIITEY